MRATKLLLIFLVIFLIHQYADVEARTSGRSKSKPKSKSKSKVSSSSSTSKTNANSWGSSSSSSTKKNSKTKKSYTDAQKKILKDRKDKRHKSALDKFRKEKKKSQVDRSFGKSVMRADKTGGRLILQRRGQVFFMRVRDVTERSSDGTEINKVQMKEVNFTITKDKNDTAAYGVEAAFVEMEATIDNGAKINLQLFMFKEPVNITGEDGNVYELVEGGTKANLRVDWPNSAEQLDISIAVRCGFNDESPKSIKAKKSDHHRGRKGANKPSEKRAPETFQVCANGQMTFSPSFEKDGNDVDMPEGYPLSGNLTSDGESIMTLRFKGSKIFYDPTVETGDDIGDIIEDTISAGISINSNMVLITSMSFIFSFMKLLF